MQNIFRVVKRHKQTQSRRFKRWHKHPFGWPIAVFILLVAISSGTVGVLAQHHKLVVNSSANHIVIISIKDHQQIVPTNAPNVGALISKLHIPIGKYDRVEPSMDTEIVQDNFRINIYRAVPVTVYDSGTVTTSYSAAATPRSIVTQTGRTLFAEDTVTAKVAQNLVTEGSLGQVVTVDRSVPINLNIYGTQIAVRTHAKTVSGLVQEKHIKLVEGATLMPLAETPLSSNMQVFILNKGVSIVSTEETIPLPVQNVDDNNLTLGSSAIRQVGSPGKQLVTYQITVDPATGKEISRQPIQTVVIQNPVPQIVAIGKNVAVPKDKAAIMQAAGVAESDYGYVDFIVSHEGGWGGATKSNYGGSGAYGICQALPGSKMASAGADWATNPVTQLRWCSSYANRYGGWAGAYAFWLAHRYW
jgi:uncharacterized protein YabE (DUF348 family)